MRRMELHSGRETFSCNSKGSFSFDSASWYASKLEVTICILRFGRGLRHSQIARILKKSINAIKLAIYRVRQRCPGFARAFPPYYHAGVR